MFQFAQPNYLYLLLIVPFVWGVYLYKGYRRRKNIATFGNPQLLEGLMPEVSNYKPRVKFALQLLALTALILTLAGPRLGSKLETVKSQGVEIMVALDVSNSMLAKDIAPNRLARTKQILSRMIDDLSGNKVGLIVFAGEAYTQLPITTDIVSAKMFLPSINPSMVPTQGTAIGEAIDLALNSFSPDDKSQKAIILITDGENHEAGAVEMAKKAAEKGINVHVLGVGSTKGVPLPISATDNTFRKDKEGNVVISKLNEEMAKEVAQAGKGIYLRADNSSAALRTLLEEIDKMEKTEQEVKVYSAFDEKFQYVALLALLLLLFDLFVLDKKNSFMQKFNFFS